MPPTSHHEKTRGNSGMVQVWQFQSRQLCSSSLKTALHFCCWLNENLKTGQRKVRCWSRALWSKCFFFHLKINCPCSFNQLKEKQPSLLKKFPNEWENLVYQGSQTRGGGQPQMDAKRLSSNPEQASSSHLQCGEKANWLLRWEVMTKGDVTTLSRDPQQ